MPGIPEGGARTPDRQPGKLSEGQGILLGGDGDVAATGEVQFTSDRIVYRRSAGVQTLLDYLLHDEVDQLCHELDETCWASVHRTDGCVDEVVVWSQEEEPRVRIRDVAVVWAGAVPTMVTQRQYDASGSVVATLTCNLSYVDGDVVDVAYTRS